jgi:hypothetical protein
LSYDSTILADSPVLFWKLNETSGTVATDASGNSYNGTYTGSYTQAVTGIGDGETGVNFTGGGINGPAGNPNLGAGNMSVELWFNASTLGSYAALWDSGTSNSARAYSIQVNGGSSTGVWLAFGKPGGGGAQVALSSGITTTNLYHIVATSTGSTAIIYLNGASVLTTSAAGVFGVANLGADSCALFQNPSGGAAIPQGMAAKFAIYNTVLTPTQVTAHYNAAAPTTAAAAVVTAPPIPT